MSSTRSKPKHVGICAMELYFPRTYVDQEELEKFDGVGSGKYTIGLDQQQMGFCGDHEDVVSLSLTVVSALLGKYKVDPRTIGFLTVGTETLIDKSKSVKTQLMELFGDNTDIEGVDVKNACFGGTQALFHAVDWVYANWETEKRFAIVVMSDIAIYAPGAARCTGGAGAFAALIGPNALISFDKGLRATYMRHTWDFYKPVGGDSSEYPVVDGPTSIKAYMSALDGAYCEYRKKAAKLCDLEVNISSFDAVMFHSPFCRHVQKAFGRLAYADFGNGYRDHLENVDKLEEISSIPVEDSYMNRDFAKAVLCASKKLWESKVEPNLFFNRRVGNMYTPSLYAQLVALFHRSNSLESVLGNRILFFSYGSGAASAMFSAQILDSDTANISYLNAENQYKFMKQSADMAASRLDARKKVSPQRYVEVLLMRENLVMGKVPYTPKCLQVGSKSEDLRLFPGTYFLTFVDEKYRRSYARTDEN